MLSPASSAVIRISVLVFLIVLPSRAQETNSTNPQAAEKAKALDVNWLYGAYVPKEIPLVTLTRRQRFKLYFAQSFTTPGIYIRSTVFSLSAQITNSPPEWGGGVAGYARRFGSRYGQSLIQNTLSSGGNALLGYEPRYDRCRCTGFWPRTGHAFMRNNDRGECENRIEEFKNGFAADRLSCHRFRANAFRLLLHSFAYNLVNLFRLQLRRSAIPSPVTNSLSALPILASDELTRLGSQS
jgi:hypothetical protein